MSFWFFVVLLVCLLSVANSATSTQPTTRKPPRIAAAWYASWHSDKQSAPDFPLSSVPWHKYTHLTWAFAETSPNVNQLDVAGSNLNLLPQFVAQAHRNDVKALISVGGWTGSRFFSSAVATAANRTAFIRTLSNFVQTYGLDGIDFDWEYPGVQGLGCNTISRFDTTNFLSFLQEFRNTTIGSRLILTAATAVSPFPDANGNPSNVAPFAKVLDWIAIMNYDLSGPWNSPPIVGPNAPLHHSCQPAQYQYASATSAVQKWNQAGIPLDQLVLGVPSYGHGFKVNKRDAFQNGQLKLYASFDPNSHPPGDVWDGSPGLNACGVHQNQGGVFNYWGLMQEGYLTPEGHPLPHPNISYRYDSCTQTPLIYNSSSEVMVSYDNRQSSVAKGEFIQANGLAGFATWEAGGDYNDHLLDAIRSGAGFAI